VSTSRSLRTAATILLMATASCRTPGAPASTSAASDSPSYRVVHGWPQLPEGDTLGAVTGVGVSPGNLVFVFHRSGRTWPDSDQRDLSPIPSPTVTVFDAPTGRIVARWGSGRFAMPHGLTVDRTGRIWLTDVALHQVYAFTPDGSLLMTLGERGVPGRDASHFDRPTQVAVAANGVIFVADGYRNSRVVRFAPDGKYLGEWGTPGKGKGQFDVPHAVAFDADGRLLVVDRGNARVQIFDPTGVFIGEWTSPEMGRPYDVAVLPARGALVVDGGDQPEAPPDRSALVVLDLQGTVHSRIGRWGNQDGHFMLAHDLAVGPDGAVYVGDILGGRVQKFAP
jgi:peptidylamidoglycolate lyase